MFAKWINDKLSELCVKSLEGKWDYDSKAALSDTCNFCDNCNFYCNECICPPEICAKHASEGYIHVLMTDFDDETTIDCLDTYEIEHMRELFKKYIL